MQANKTVTINGRTYDAVTGLPVEKKPAAKTTTSKPATKQRSGHVAASAVHTTAQRSQTLHRRSAKKTAIAKRPQPGRHMDIARSSSVKRFASHPVSAPAAEKKAPAKADTPAKTHPTAARAAHRAAIKPKAAPAPTAKQVKEAAITAALATPAQKPAKKKRGWKWSRRMTIATACFVVLIIGAYLTYVNLPSLSVGFASAQAGIQASYPEYRPDGYHLSQPVTFSDGKVSLSFASNSGTGSFTINQTRSTWDSSAVLDNVVKPAAGDNYVTTMERGLTIYSYDDNTRTVWVNGGILYEIVRDAPLSPDQIRRIATSL